MAVGDFTAGSVVYAVVDSMVLQAVFMVGASAVGVALSEGSDITDFMVVPFTGTTATLTTTTDAIIRLGLRSAKCGSSFEGHGPESPSVIYLDLDNGVDVHDSAWLEMKAQRHLPCKTVQAERARSIRFRQRHLVRGTN
jgi:hypothetical protein